MKWHTRVQGIVCSLVRGPGGGPKLWDKTLWKLLAFYDTCRKAAAPPLSTGAMVVDTTGKNTGIGVKRPEPWLSSKKGGSWKQSVGMVDKRELSETDQKESKGLEHWATV